MSDVIPEVSIIRHERLYALLAFQSATTVLVVDVFVVSEHQHH